MGTTTRPPRVSFFVSYGSEDFLLDRDIERARSWPNREVFLLDGEDITESKLISCMESASYAPRTFILDNAQKVKLTKMMRGFVEDRSKTDTLTVFLAVVRDAKLPAGWAYVAEKGELREAKKLKYKPWQPDEFFQWIDGEAARHDLKLSQEIKKILLEFVGTDLYRLASEIRKIAVFVGPQGEITKQQLALFISSTQSATHFEIAEATLAKNPLLAMNRFSILYKNEGMDCLGRVTSALMKRVEQVFIIKDCSQRGVDADIAAASVGFDVNKFPFKQISEVAKKYELTDLIRHMSRLCKLDVDIKSAASSKRTLVELAILDIAR